MSLLALVSVLIALPVSTGFLLAILAAVWFFDRYDREPLVLVGAAFVWGATAAPLLTIAVSTFPLPATFGPLVEEVTKGVAIILIALLSKDFDNPADGIVYGTAVGLGFAVTENVLYGLTGALESSPAQVIALVVGRTLFSAGVHGLASSVFGGFAGVARLTRRWPSRVLWLLIGMAGATALHSGWNIMLATYAVPGREHVVLGWILILFFLYGVYLLVFALFLAGEHRILARELSEEVELGVLPKWVATVMPFYRRRVRADWWPERGERTVIARQVTRLAFRKHELRRMERARAEIAGLEVVQLRSRLRTILRIGESGEGPEE